MKISHNKTIMVVAFTSDNSKFVTGSFDNTAALWDLKTGYYIFSIKI